MIKVGDYVYTIQNQEKIFGKVINIVDQDYLLVQFKNKSCPISIHKDKIGQTYFLADKNDEYQKQAIIHSQAQTNQTIEEEEWICAKQIIGMYEQKLYDLNQLFYQRDHHYELVAFETDESIKQKRIVCQNILDDPFKYHLYFVNAGNNKDIRLGIYPIEIEGSNIVIYSLNSYIYGELLMKNRLGQTKITLNNETYFIEKRRDISFKNKKLKKVTEITFDNFTKKTTSTNLDKYLLDTLSKDELYQTRLKSNSQELQDIFWSMSATQFEIIRETLNQPLIVQGGAGTGKTSIGIHRLSYLFYNKIINQAIILGPNDFFSKFVEGSLHNVGIESSYNIKSFSRLEFYKYYYKEIQSAISVKLDTLNHYLNKIGLAPISLLQNDIWMLNRTNIEFEILTESLYNFIPWNSLLKDLNQIESCLQLNITTSFKSIDDLLISLNCALKQLEIHTDYYELTDKVQHYNTQIQYQVQNYNQILNEIKLMEKSYDETNLEIKMLTEEYQQNKNNLDLIKEKYMYYTNQLKQFQVNHQEISNRLNHSFFIGIKKQYELSSQLIEISTTLVDLLKEEYNTAKQDYIKVHEKMNSLNFNANQLNEKIQIYKQESEKLQNEIIELKNKLEITQKHIKDLKYNTILSSAQLKEVQRLILKISETLNNLTPVSFFNSLPYPLQKKNILIWIKFYFILFPSVKEKYGNTYFFIDEAQDLSLFEFQLFQEINSKFILMVGDINQNIFGYNTLINWEIPCKIYNAKFYELQYNWRATKQLVNIAHPYLTNYDYKNIGVISGFPPHAETIKLLDDFSNILTKEYLLRKIESLPDGKSCAIITLNKTQLNLLKFLLKPLIKSPDNNEGLIDLFTNYQSIQPKRIILTSIDYVKGLEFFSVILPVPFKDDLDQFQKARVYTSITRATDDLTIFLIEE